MSENDDFTEITVLLQAYLEKERSTARGGSIDHVIAKKLREKLAQMLPGLVSKFASGPDIVFVRSIVGFAAGGLDDKTSAFLWHNYYKRGDTLLEISHELNISTRTVKRFVSQFAEKIVAFWWESSMMASDPAPRLPLPLAKRAGKILEDKYGLTERQAEVLSTFCLNPLVDRPKIQDEILVISENTLKVHIGRIVKTLGVKNINQAVEKVLPVLREHLGDELSGI